MNDQNTRTPAPAITVDDIFYAVFRHKWKILTIAGAGILAAALIPLFMPREYQSEAKLFVKYVVETKSPGQVGASNTRVISDDGASAISTEVEILTSLDLAQQVAETVGPERILAKVGGGTNRYQAALVIHKNLVPDASKGSKVIRVTFKHQDPDVVQTVLNQVIQAYLRRHEEIHQHVGAFDDFLTQQTDQLRSRLLATEEELRRAKTNAGILSMADSQKTYTEQIGKIRQAIRDAEADLAERQATATQMADLLHTQVPTMTNSLAATNSVTAPPEKIAAYKRICGLIDTLSKRQQDLMVQFTPENSWVKEVESQITANEKLKKLMEDENPSLLGEKIGGGRESAMDPSAGMRATLFTETARATALQSRIRVLTEQLNALRKEAGSIDDAEGSITDLQRRQKLQEANYEYFAANLEQSKIDQALGAGRAYNISVIQAPTPNFVVSKVPKLMATVALGAILAAFGLAFLIEFYFDKSIRRPIEVESRLGVPLFISIPIFASLRRGRELKSAEKPALLPESSSETKMADGSNGGPKDPGHPDDAGAAVVPASSRSELAPWDPRYILRPFAEALRDGLITYFEVNNLTHKPKLVAVTSCTDGAGVSTIAAGLAASLSETGEGNVLLVNMNQANGSVHQFHKGDLACDLDDVLAAEKRGKALVQDNLYVATEATNGDKLPIVFPNRFKSLVPRLRASDYDYIIFDMPAVNQITSTQRLARFMDMVLMVVESEKTDRDVAKRVTSLLTQSKTHVGVVLNKTRSHGPRRLQQSS